MSGVDLVIEGATLVTADGTARIAVHVADGRIAALGTRDGNAERQIDATGLVLLPGMVDTHVHLMDPGAVEREDFPSGTAAAAARGVTTVVEHTHAHPVRTADELDDKRTYLRERSHVDFGLAAHVWPDRIDEMSAVWSAGATFFKIFTCTTHGVPGADPATLRAALTKLAEFDGPALLHCEDESLTAADEARLRATGREDGAVISEWRSRSAELVAVHVAAELVRQTGARATIAHVSSPEVAGVIVAARERGADLAAEACPQYFLLREQELLTEGPLRKFTPPTRARTDADEDALWALLREGVFSHVSSDHAPATRAQKADGSIWDVPFGLPGLDTTFPILLDAALSGRLSLPELARVYSRSPAQRYGLWPRKGDLRIGSDADLVLVDPDGETRIDDDLVLSKAGWTPYAGRTVRGSHVASYLRGQVVAESGTPTRQFAGRFVSGPGARRSP